MIYGLPIFFLLLFFLNIASAATVNEFAKPSAKGLGVITQSSSGKFGQVILFEENHASLNGQIEIAHILVRLYKNNGLRKIALEGAFTSQKLKPDWAKSMNAQDRLNVSARLLGDGELNSAEFMTSAFHDVTVKGIDDESAYKFDLDNQASTSTHFYLLLIAEESLTTSQGQRIDKLFEDGKIKEAIDVAINADTWTKKMYNRLFTTSRIVSTEETLGLLKEIQHEARKRGITIPEEVVKGMKKKEEFFEAAGRRSDIMGSKIARLAKDNPNVPIAAIIGAAHTERMADFLKDHSITFVVIRPNALADRGGITEQGIDYQRKVEGFSVDTNGLGAMLDGHRKPPPVLSTQWLTNKANIYQTTTSIVKQILIDGNPPPYKHLKLPRGVHVDPDKITLMGDEVIFPVEVVIDQHRETIWVRAAYSKNVVQSEQEPANIENRIQNLLAEAGGGGSRDKEPPTGKNTKTGESSEHNNKKKDSKSKDVGRKKPRSDARHITEGIYAKFSKHRSEIEKKSVFISTAS